MASLLRQASSSLAMPTSTSFPLIDIPIPSFILGASSQPTTWLCTSAALVGALLILEQSIYRYKKKHLPGATWTIPIIGKFADSMKPTMEGYIAQWNLGALSVVSVFNMYVSITRKTLPLSSFPQFHRHGLVKRILAQNLQLSQPRRAMPCQLCQVHSHARQLVCPIPPLSPTLPLIYYSSRVFLNGKAHVEYRRTLNALFTRKALRYFRRDMASRLFLTK